MVRLVASTQGSFHSMGDMGEQIRDPCTPLLQRACLRTVCPQHRGRAHPLGATTTFLSKRRLPGAPCSVPRHQLQQNLSPLPLYWKWCGLPYRVSNTTPTYLRNFWRSSPPSATVLEKYIIMMSAHWKRHNSSTPFPLCNLFLTNSIFWETVRPSFSETKDHQNVCRLCLYLTSSLIHMLDLVSQGLKTSF